MLCYAMLYYTILCYTILNYTIPHNEETLTSVSYHFLCIRVALAEQSEYDDIVTPEWFQAVKKLPNFKYRLEVS
jgi:hypothetical protein